MSEPIALRTSCLIERAIACADDFDRAGFTVSADLTRSFAVAMQDGFPSALYEHWIGEQEARLARKLNERSVA
jgi:hypothetical protein